MRNENYRRLAEQFAAVLEEEFARWIRNCNNYVHVPVSILLPEILSQHAILVLSRKPIVVEVFAKVFNGAWRLRLQTRLKVLVERYTEREVLVSPVQHENSLRTSRLLGARDRGYQQ